MKKGLNELVFILDETGSMQPLASEAVIGFNNFLEDQKKFPGEANLTLVLFNSGKTTKIFDRVDIKHAVPFKHSDYSPNNMTPLLDTIGNAIDELGDKLKNVPEHERPEKIIFAIMTDGQENYSIKFNRTQIFDKITHQRDMYKWEFIFLGANQDSYAEAGSLGIPTQNISNYQHTPDGTLHAYHVSSSLVKDYRTTSEL